MNSCITQAAALGIACHHGSGFGDTSQANACGPSDDTGAGGYRYRETAGSLAILRSTVTVAAASPHLFELGEQASRDRDVASMSNWKSDRIELSSTGSDCEEFSLLLLPFCSANSECGYSCNVVDSDALNRQGEYVADAALGLDDTRHARICLQFAPQSQDLHVDTAVEHILVYPGRLQQLFPTERSLWRVEKGCQKRVFALR